MRFICTRFFKFLMSLLVLPPLLTVARPMAKPMTHQEFVQLGTALKKVYVSELEVRSRSEGRSHILLVNENEFDTWTIDYQQASYVGFYDDLFEPPSYVHRVNVFGSLAKLPYLSKAGVALIACHEIGHGFSSGPKKNNGDALEGESDYYAARVCLKKLIDIGYLSVATLNEEYKNLCFARFQSLKDKQTCLVKMKAVEEIKIYLETDFFYKSPVKLISQDQARLLDRQHNEDTSISNNFNTRDDFYPSAQCRFESFLHGALELPRPACW